MLHIDATHLGRAMNCGGSRLMDRPTLPDTSDSTIRDEGNAFHWLAKEIFDGKIHHENAVGIKAYNGVFITAAMVEHAVEYIDSIWPGEMEIQTTWGDIGYQINARADHVGWNPNISELSVDDIKYGYGIVEPDLNWTLIAHAIGYVLKTGVNPVTIKLSIYQPRAYHPLGSVRPWVISYAELLAYKAQIHQVLSNPSDVLNTGLHCYKCPAMSLCPAYRMASMNAIDATSIAFNDKLTAEELAYELDLLEQAQNVIANRKKAIDELALFRAANGMIFPNRIIDRPKGQTRYKKGATPEFLQVLIGRDLSERKAPKISDLKNNGVAQMIIDAITERPEGSPRLVKVNVNKLAEKKLKSGVK